MQLSGTDAERLRQYDLDHIIHPQFHRADHEGAVIYRVAARARCSRTPKATSTSMGSHRCGTSLSGMAVAELADAAAAQMRKLAFSNSYTGLLQRAGNPVGGEGCRPCVRQPERRVLYQLRLRVERRGLQGRALLLEPARSAVEDEDQFARERAYHGGTLAATAITGMAPFHKGFGPEPPDFVQVPTCYPYRCQWCSAKPSCTLECADNIEATIEREGADSVAAVIAEPVHGAGGVIPPDPGYWPRLREICDRHDVLPRRGVHADVEGFVRRHQKRNGVRNLLVGDFIAVHLQHAYAALGDAGSVIGKIEHEGVLARRERIRTFPTEPLQIDEVVGEHRLALQHIQTISAEPAAFSDNHPIAAALWDFHLGGDRVGFGQDVRCVAYGNTRHFIRVGEFGLSRGGARPRRDRAREL